jgi:hypothetical protein
MHGYRDVFKHKQIIDGFAFRVLKPANSLRWHKEVLDWLETWKKAPSPSVKDDGLSIKNTATSLPIIPIEDLVKGIQSTLTGPRFELQE